MPGVDGFEFLVRFRALECARKVPVIVWRVKEVTPEERALLQNSAQAVVSKAGDRSWLVAELGRQLPIPEKSAV